MPILWNMHLCRLLKTWAHTFVQALCFWMGFCYKFSLTCFPCEIQFLQYVQRMTYDTNETYLKRCFLKIFLKRYLIRVLYVFVKRCFLSRCLSINISWTFRSWIKGKKLYKFLFVFFFVVPGKGFKKVFLQFVRCHKVLWKQKVCYFFNNFFWNTLTVKY